MPRPRGYDLQELQAAWESDNFTTAPEVMEFLGIPAEHLRGVQAQIRRLYGRRPKAASKLRQDVLRRRVVRYLVDQCGLRSDYCFQCQTYAGTDTYLRELRQGDDLGSLVFVCKRCKRAGDI